MFLIFFFSLVFLFTKFKKKDGILYLYDILQKYIWARVKYETYKIVYFELII